MCAELRDASATSSALNNIRRLAGEPSKQSLHVPSIRKNDQRDEHVFCTRQTVVTGSGRMLESVSFIGPGRSMTRELHMGRGSPVSGQ